MYERPDHELEVLEEDETVPPRPEEAIADADRAGSRDVGNLVVEPRQDDAARPSANP